MADYWKSQPKKFCTYCKCWIADNKPSVEFHERGKNHKENVTKKINEIKQKSMDKAKKDEKMSKEFAAMEEAALKAYQEDLKRLEGTAQTSAPSLSSVQNKKARDEEKWKEIEALEKHHAKWQWTKSLSPEGYPYYYNALTGESRWEKPEGFKENSKSEEASKSSAWVEAVSEEGYTYYYNTETGESRWDKPENTEPVALTENTDSAIPTDSTDSVVSTENIKEEHTEALDANPTAEAAEDDDPAITQKTKINFRVKTEIKLESDGESGSGLEQKEPEPASDETAAIEDKPVKEEQPTPEISRPSQSKPNPYGMWEEVKEEEDPYENVDLELPNVESDFPEVPVQDIPCEPAVKFKEKTITSLGDLAEGSSVFKKRKLENATTKMENPVYNLKNFSKLDFQSKLGVINNGRPMPALKDLLQTKGQKNPTRSFQMEWYQRKDWLCGCATKSRLYCFPCLLFSNTHSVWTNDGFCDLKNLSRSLSKHEKSVTHIQCQIDLKTFGASRTDQALNEQRRLNVSIHNAKVKENRVILKDLIDVTCFLAKQDLAFRANDESSSSSNCGNFVELLHAFVEKDEKLALHLQTSTVFSGLSDRIQNNLIEAVADVIRNDIKEEVNAAPFVAVEVDETTDGTNKAQISVILRYVAKTAETCEVKEAFLGFKEMSDKQAPAIAAYVLGVLGKYNCVEKLVAQTYDGASVMASDLNGVVAKIKEKVPEATFIHCYAHKLNLVLMHSAKSIPECRSFFKTVEGLATFFHKSATCTQLLDDVVKQRLPRAAPTRWSSHSRLVQIISMYQSDLRAAFQIMSENPDDWDIDTLILATGYDLWLSKASSCFLIMAYEGIFNETNGLARLLQNKITDIGLCCTRVRDIMGIVERQREEFDSFYERFQQKCITLGLTDIDQSKKQTRNEWKRMFYSILDNVSAQMKARFDRFGDLTFLDLADCTKFQEISQHFDETKLQSLSNYARYFDFARLKSDLIGLYSSKLVRNECKSPRQLLSFLAQNDLMHTVPEATKLLQLVLTIPATVASVERPFTALKQLKTYIRNQTDQGRHSSLATISIERERLSKLKNKEDFYNKVTDIFVQKDGRMDFIYM